MANEPRTTAGKAADAGKSVVNAGEEATQQEATQEAMNAGARATREMAGAGARIASETAGTGAHIGASAARAGADFARTTADNAAAMGGEFMRLFSDMRTMVVPDVQSLMDAHRRNLETLSAANKVALEGAQAVARRHMEIMQQTMGELTETMRQLTAADAPQSKAAKQAELLKHAYEHAVANMRELRDLIQRSNSEALDLLNRRFMEAMDEVKTLMERAKTDPRQG